jgi:hypothetical protein
MFRITEDPSSGNLVKCLAKSYKNGSIVSFDIDKVNYSQYHNKVYLLVSDVY